MELADLDSDGDVDLLFANGGDYETAGKPVASQVFLNDGEAGFEEATRQVFGDTVALARVIRVLDVDDDGNQDVLLGDANQGWDDNAVVALDVESDGDADFLIGSLDGWDRLWVNDGSGGLTLQEPVFDGGESAGTLGFAVADLDGDGRPDVVDAQGEVEGHEDERVWLGTQALDPDTAAPVVRTARWADGERDLTWYGENLFRATLPETAQAVEVCAVDAAGNETCEPVTG